jgi:hypothetical protein
MCGARGIGRGVATDRTLENVGRRTLKAGITNNNTTVSPVTSFLTCRDASYVTCGELTDEGDRLVS